MPSVKDFENKNEQAAATTAAAVDESSAKKSTRPRRRPGRDDVQAGEIAPDEASVHDDVEPAVTAGLHSDEAPAAGSADRDAAEPANEPASGEPAPEEPAQKVEINFPYSELLRAKVPQAFDLAEAVATDWVHDGRFEALPVGHPLAQLAAQVGFRKAKDLEKKLEEKGVFMLARVGYQYAKSKLNRG